MSSSPYESDSSSDEEYMMAFVSRKQVQSNVAVAKSNDQVEELDELERNAMEIKRQFRKEKRDHAAQKEQQNTLNLTLKNLAAADATNKRTIDIEVEEKEHQEDVAGTSSPKEPKQVDVPKDLQAGYMAGEKLFNRNKFADAVDLWGRVYTLHEAQLTKQGCTWTIPLCGGLGIAHAKNGDLRLAIEFLNRTLSVAASDANKPVQVKMLSELAQVYTEVGNLSAAANATAELKRLNGEVESTEDDAQDWDEEELDEVVDEALDGEFQLLLEILAGSSEIPLSLIVDYQHSFSRITPMIAAAANGEVEVMASLLDVGASLDHTDVTGDGPLHHACSNKQYDAVAFLLSRGVAPPSAEDRAAYDEAVQTLLASQESGKPAKVPAELSKKTASKTNKASNEKAQTKEKPKNTKALSKNTKAPPKNTKAPPKNTKAPPKNKGAEPNIQGKATQVNTQPAPPQKQSPPPTSYWSAVTGQAEQPPKPEEPKKKPSAQASKKSTLNKSKSKSDKPTLGQSSSKPQAKSKTTDAAPAAAKKPTNEAPKRPVIEKNPVNPWTKLDKPNEVGKTAQAAPAKAASKDKVAKSSGKDKVAKSSGKDKVTKPSNAETVARPTKKDDTTKKPEAKPATKGITPTKQPAKEKTADAKPPSAAATPVTQASSPPKPKPTPAFSPMMPMNVALAMAKKGKLKSIKKTEPQVFRTPVPDNTSAAAARGDLKDRDLSKWQGDESGVTEELSDDKGGENWDQFQANKEKFGIDASFPEKMYTSELDHDKIPDDIKAKAAKIAAEMENEKRTGSNDRDVGDEEAIHSAVNKKDANAEGDSFTDASVAKKVAQE